MSVLVTGGAGYIGSHTVIDLIANGFDVVVVDNLCNSKKVALERVEAICGKKIKFYQKDVCDKASMRKIFAKEAIDSVIHFAGLKAVGESCAKPLQYYQNNLVSTLTLVEVMKEFGCKNLVFSSSATVYGQPKSVPIREDFP
ncbi:MAG: SDR family NAD(P)-dependent oxidoreductase, partial [Clostridia bacterium]